MRRTSGGGIALRRNSLRQKNSFVEVAYDFGVVRGAWVMDDHDDRLLRIAVQRFQDGQDFIRRLRIEIPTRYPNTFIGAAVPTCDSKYSVSRAASICSRRSSMIFCCTSFREASSAQRTRSEL